MEGSRRVNRRARLEGGTEHENEGFNGGVLLVVVVVVLVLVATGGLSISL